MQLQKQRSKCNHNNCLNSSTIWTLMFCYCCCCFIQSDIVPFFRSCSVRFCPCFWFFFILCSQSFQSFCKNRFNMKSIWCDQMVCIYCCLIWRLFCACILFKLLCIGCRHFQKNTTTALFSFALKKKKAA